ncbi:MAG: carbamate kinase [Deltaproteobacteria bacterium]|nr:carbamate kinase [Deltaproteobacteria bacterium]MCK5709827.1 carbamate kinase [Deltaproteobacteria bacterium]
MKGKEKIKAAVVAFGGNALMGEDGNSTYAEQIIKTDIMCNKLMTLFNMGYRILITHGNGPQVGNFLMQQECLAENVPPMPLDACNAMTQGQIGYMIGHRLRNTFTQNNIKKPVIVFITQIVVSEDDPAFKNPTKFIGPFFNKAQSEKLSRDEGWLMREDSGRGYRRIVASPKPIDIIEKEEIAEMAHKDFVVIACGGGGIPVIRDEKGCLKGVPAVIDKDFAAEKIGTFIGAELLLLITPVDRVAINFGTPEQKSISQMTLDEAEHYFAEGHFAPGSMGPKVQAAIQFLRSGGKRAIITSIDNIESAIKGEGGTQIVHSH